MATSIEILADELVDELFTDSARRDDVAVLVLRSPVMSHGRVPQEGARPHERARPAASRPPRMVGAAVDDGAQVNAILTTIGEACANAIDHALHNHRDPLMRVEATLLGDE
jgi:hypothetical protein